MTEITVATVQTGNYCGRGKEYVAKLIDGVRRNMPKDIVLSCVCITDDAKTLPPGVLAKDVTFGPPSWWQKLLLFKPGMFAPGTRVLYFDLDTIILGDLRDFAEYRGDFACIKDPFQNHAFSSALMAWEAGKYDHVWTMWDQAGRPQFDPRGDQQWIGQMVPEKDEWQTILPGQLVSFKKDCWLQGFIPKEARVLFFHGNPRPHSCRAADVMALWDRPLSDDALKYVA